MIDAPLSHYELEQMRSAIVEVETQVGQLEWDWVAFQAPITYQRPSETPAPTEQRKRRHWWLPWRRGNA